MGSLPVGAQTNLGQGIGVVLGQIPRPRVHQTLTADLDLGPFGGHIGGIAFGEGVGFVLAQGQAWILGKHAA